MGNELKMTVSPVCMENDKKYAYVSFTDETRSAEGKIPECSIIRNEGFTEKEVQQLEDYMRRELTNLKKMAAGNNIMNAFLK